MSKWVVVVGVDWGKYKHWVDEGVGKPYQVLQTPTDILRWIAELRARYPEGRIGVAVEQHRGALIHALMEYDFIDLLPLNPAQTGAYRQAVRPSGGKDDPTDATMIRIFAEKHQDQLEVWQPHDARTRELAYLTEWRRKLVDQNTGLLQQVDDALMQYFPQARELAGEAGSPMWCAFLKEWPTLDAVLQARATTLQKFYRKHGSRSSKLIESRLALVASAVPVTRDAALINSRAAIVEALVTLIATLVKEIGKLQGRIAGLWQSHPDRAIFESLPGAGECLAPRLAVVLGSDRDRWDAKSLQTFSGVAPIIIASGKSRTVAARFRCPKFLRQTFHEFALHSIGHSEWARRFYDHQRARGKSQHTALRALAFRWIRIIVACWKSATPYCEARYLASLAHRGSPSAKIA